VRVPQPTREALESEGLGRESLNTGEGRAAKETSVPILVSLRDEWVTGRLTAFPDRPDAQ
jgi:hypothetical protein